VSEKHDDTTYPLLLFSGTKGLKDESRSN